MMVHSAGLLVSIGMVRSCNMFGIVSSGSLKMLVGNRHGWFTQEVGWVSSVMVHSLIWLVSFVVVRSAVLLWIR